MLLTYDILILRHKTAVTYFMPHLLSDIFIYTEFYKYRPPTKLCI